MYEQLQADPKSRRPKTLRILLCAVILVGVVVTAAVAWAATYHVRYRDFISRLSDSVTYAYSHHSLHGNAGEAEPVWVRGENVYRLYNYVMVSGEGKVLHQLPESEPLIDMDFGDGSTLRVWDTSPGGATLCYEDQKGQYAYVSKAMSAETIQVNFLSLSGNVAWKE